MIHQEIATSQQQSNQSVPTVQMTQELFYSLYYPPANYQHWYQQLPEKQKQKNTSPELYQKWYMNWHCYFSSFNAQQSMNAYSANHYSQRIMIQQKENKKEKLSRNQKRKQKKRQLQQEYDREKAQIGKWVDLQRKDLVENLKKIEEKQQKIRQKKRQKLSHLIEIHKQVYKHALKKNKVAKTIPTGRKNFNGGFRKKQKKPSHIKKMKQMYKKIYGPEIEQNRFNEQQIMKEIRKTEQKQHKYKKYQKKEQQIVQDHDDDGFITESEQQSEISSKNQQQPHKNNPSKQQIALLMQDKIIAYKKIGKLNGIVYNGITLREWVDNVPNPELQDKVLRLVNRLAYKQAIKKINQPQKAKKLIIAGIHESLRTLRTLLEKKRSKLLILALNIERNNLQRGTDDQIQNILNFAEQKQVPIIHTSTRSKLGRAFTGKFGPRITVLSIVNYEGYGEMMEEVLQQWKQAKKKYQNTNSFHGFTF